MTIPHVNCTNSVVQHKLLDRHKNYGHFGTKYDTQETTSKHLVNLTYLLKKLTLKHYCINEK